MASSNTDLDVRLSVLENMVVGQNESVNARLTAIERVLTEIHNKQDTYILNQSNTITRLEAEIEHLKQEDSKQSGRISKQSAMLLAIVTTLIGGLLSLLSK
jgi:hypothetical protein